MSRGLGGGGGEKKHIFFQRIINLVIISINGYVYIYDLSYFSKVRTLTVMLLFGFL